MNAIKAAHPRRGALLLLVLGVLTLFLLMGTMVLTLATRTRTTARAFALATAGQAARPLLAREQLEQAVMALLRGGPNATEAGLGESLLADMYGTEPPLEGRATALVARGPLVEATVEIAAAATPPRAAELCGRVLTFKPDPESGDTLTSMRVMRAIGTGPFTCWLARPQSAAAVPLPRSPCTILVNQPAFRAEAYDAYDENNPWLTRVALADGAVTSVPRPAFAAAGTTAVVDNDNDGVRDGVWLEGIFDSLPAPGGGRLEFDASYLVVDLDGRINVNAHGSRTSIDFPAADGWWTKAPSVPTGSGYGPADIDASLAFVEPLRNNQTPADPPAASDHWRRIVGVAPIRGLTATAASADQRRPVPIVGSVEGRYGPGAVAGAPGDDLVSRRSELLYGNNPLVDLKSMIKVQMETGKNSGSAVPKMVYFCPDWSLAGYADDPYEMRLDGDAPRPLDLRSNALHADNPFTLGDLEAVLRQFDTDATTLPPRLAVVLDDASQRSRMIVTTDSWDTPGLTGAVAGEITAYIAGLSCDPDDVMSPDVLGGLRFDINRPFPGGAAEADAKQDFCKHLFVLLVALGQPANAATAQWAVNVVDYRDPDSRFTRFQFDTNPTDGWGADTAGWNAANVVWGAERPELVIAQTLAWRADNDPAVGELLVSLHRPWNAERISANGSSTPVDVLDPALAARTNPNVLDLSKKNGNDPIWRLRFDEDTKFVRFDPPQQNDSHPAFPAGCKTFTSNQSAELPPNTYLVVKPKGVSKQGIKVANGLKEFEITKGGTFRAEHWSGAGNDQPGSDTMVFLERLADPTLPWHAASNPYVPVDQLGIKLVNRSGNDPNNWRSFFRDPPFWRDRPFSKIMQPPVVSQLDPEATNWLPWANRAFISHAELLLVPQGSAISMLSGYDIPKNKKATNPYYFLPSEKLLEATIVPSRFAGSQVTVDPNALAPVGMEKIPFNQLSRWREPGRVNLNTIIPNRDCSDPQRNDAVWWATLGPDAAVSLDEYAAAGPARSIRDLLSLMQQGGVYIDTAAASGVKGNSWKKNRPYDLNPAAAYASAIRLANVATIRSHVFAVWVTLRVRDTSPGGVASYHRSFAIVDRSHPVGFSAGQDLNVRDVIRVLRVLE
jgi:hypothetical protein